MIQDNNKVKEEIQTKIIFGRRHLLIPSLSKSLDDELYLKKLIIKACYEQTEIIQEKLKIIDQKIQNIFKN